MGSKKWPKREIEIPGLFADLAALIIGIVVAASFIVPFVFILFGICPKMN